MKKKEMKKINLDMLVNILGKRTYYFLAMCFWIVFVGYCATQKMYSSMIILSVLWFASWYCHIKKVIEVKK